MQFALSTTKEALLSPLNFVAGAADYRGTVPMLGTALLKTTGGRLSLLCSDGAVLARTLAECKIDHEGELAVDARRFGDLIKAMPDKQAISLAMDGEQLLVKAGRSRFRLPVHSAEDYLFGTRLDCSARLVLESAGSDLGIGNSFSLAHPRAAGMAWRVHQRRQCQRDPTSG